MPDYSEVDMKGVCLRYKLIQGECVKPVLDYIKHQFEKSKMDKQIEEQTDQSHHIFEYSFTY